MSLVLDISLSTCLNGVMSNTLTLTITGGHTSYVGIVTREEAHNIIGDYNEGDAFYDIVANAVNFQDLDDSTFVYGSMTVTFTGATT